LYLSNPFTIFTLSNMTKPVELTISLGGAFIANYQKINGEIISEGTTDRGDDYIMFQDAESDKPHRIYKRKITNIADTKSNTTIEPGG
jgi:hypothetical protein